jgi:hypothetical protein
VTENKKLHDIEGYYSDKVRRHGATAKGVDWNSEQGQELRFHHLISIIPANVAGSVLDFGSGYGALLPYLKKTRPGMSYLGVDLSEEMLKEARRVHAADRAEWVTEVPDGKKVDFSICSGTFNVKLDRPASEWWSYITSTLDFLWERTEKGMAFNLLTSFFDPGFDRPHLFYSDPAELMSFCMKRYSKRIALFHQYPLYEFTVHLHKEKP